MLKTNPDEILKQKKDLRARTNRAATCTISVKYLIAGLNFSCMSHTKKTVSLVLRLPRRERFVAVRRFPSSMISLALEHRLVRQNNEIDL